MEIKAYKRNTFFKTITPENTIEKLKRGFKKLKLEETIKSTKNSDELWSTILNINKLRVTFNGKGTSEIEATVSAYAEAVERLSAGPEPQIELAPYKQLFGFKNELYQRVTRYKYINGYKWVHQDSLDKVLGVEDLLGKQWKMSEEQYKFLKQKSHLLRHWIPGYSFTRQDCIHLPILFVKWISASNGLGAGNTLEEALIHSVCEIFERYCLIRAVRFRELKTYPTVDRTTINNQTIQNILDYFDSNNIEIFIKYIGEGVFPVYAVVTYNKKLEKNRIGYNTIKAGSSLNSEEAIIRCLTERMQGTTFNWEESLGTTVRNDPDRYLPLFFEGLCMEDLEALKEGPTIQFSQEKYENTKEELEKCIEILSTVNKELVFINHTHPIFNFPVVRAIVPEMSDYLHWWDPAKVNINMLGQLTKDDDEFEDALINLLQSFENKGAINLTPFAVNNIRRDK